MTAITTIRIDHDTLPEPLNRNGAEAAARMIEVALREEGISAEASDLFSHIKIDLPTAQLAAASGMLTGLKLI